jgi:hypothetical protein
MGFNSLSLPEPDASVILRMGDSELRRGTVVRNRVTGDVGDVQWVAARPSAFMSPAHRPSAPVADLLDYYMKVNVWREGAPRIWMGSNVELVERKDK